MILPASTGELVKLELGEIDFPLPPDQTQSNVAARGSAKLKSDQAARPPLFLGGEIMESSHRGMKAFAVVLPKDAEISGVVSE